MFVCIAQIPQRLITVNGLSSLDAAVRLLAFGACVPFGSGLGGALMGKPRIPPCWVVLAGAVFEVIGVVFLSRISTAPQLDKNQYGFQVLAGLGTGLVNAGLTILVPYAMEERDLGEHVNISSVCLLTYSSRWFRGDISVSHPRWSSRHCHCHVNLHAVHSHPLVRDCAD